MARPAAPVAEDVKVRGAIGTVATNPRSATIGRGQQYTLWDYHSASYFDNPTHISDEEKRLMLCDPQVNALLSIRRMAVLVDGVQIVPQPDLEIKDPVKFEKSQKLADFLIWNFVNMRHSFHGKLFALSQADWWKNIALDLVYREQEWGAYKGKLCLDRMRTLPRGSYNIVVDAEGEVIGLSDGSLTKDGEIRAFPIEKFAFYAFRPDASTGDPRGTDLASAVRTPWYMKNQTHPEQLKNLAQFGSPSLVGTAPEDAVQLVPLLGPNEQPLLDEEGRERLVPVQQAMLNGLQQFGGNGSVTVIPGGATLAMLEAQGDGRIWTNAVDGWDWQMAVGILGTGNMQMRQKYGSNATAQTGKETVDIPIFGDKQEMAELVRKQLCEPLVRYNYPEDYWDCMPVVRMGDPRRDFKETLAKSILASNQNVGQGIIQQVWNWIGGEIRDDLFKVNQPPTPGTVPVNPDPGEDEEGEEK